MDQDSGPLFLSGLLGDDLVVAMTAAWLRYGLSMVDAAQLSGFVQLRHFDQCPLATPLSVGHKKLLN